MFVETGKVSIAYPLLLAPLVVEKVWGGDSLARRFPYGVPEGLTIGEVWVVWDGLRIANGPLAGRTVKELFALAPMDFVEQTTPGQPAEGFPLLLKFLDARENLSIQVHPDDDYARSREGQPYGKCEMWYVLDAAEGAVVFHGLRRDLEPSEVRDVLNGPSIVDALEQVEVHRGDVLINTPGTIHALGAGAVIFEIQQSCDLTYRLYDWDRALSGAAPRELHLGKGGEVMDRRALLRHKIEPITLDEGAYRRRLLGASRYFAAELLELPDSTAISLAPHRLNLVTVLDGALRVRATEPRSDWFDVTAGHAALVPAVVSASEIVAVGDAQFIRSYIPNLQTEIVELLIAMGVDAEQIAQLGGASDRSDLGRILQDHRTEVNRRQKLQPEK